MQQSYAEDRLHQFGISDIVPKYIELYFQWICELYYHVSDNVSHTSLPLSVVAGNLSALTDYVAKYE